MYVQYMSCVQEVIPLQVFLKSHQFHLATFMNTYCLEQFFFTTLVTVISKIKKELLKFHVDTIFYNESFVLLTRLNNDSSKDDEYSIATCN